MLKRIIDASKNKKVRVAVGALAAHIIITNLTRVIKTKRVQARWRRVAQQKQAVIKEKIAIFVDEHLKNFQISEKLKWIVLGSTINGLKKLLFEGQVTVVQILLLYIERTVNHGVRNNWIADVCFAEALEEAKLQDLQIQQNRQILYQEGKELFGIPVTIKDMFGVKGTDSTYGLASRCFKPVQVDGNQASMIRLAGGIIFAKTNIPQIGYCIETNNFVFGQGLNPYNPKYTVGGSSGGEGAMLTGLCSVIGLGNDIGGSIRFPAGFNGVYSYKPSTRRICVQGCDPLHNVHEGYKNLVVTNGPLARCTDDCALMMSVLLNPQHYESLPSIQKDIYFNPRPWNREYYQQNGNLKIGYFTSLEFVPSSQANRRAVQMAVEALVKQGHTLVQVDLGDMLKEALKYAVTFASVDDLRVFKEVLQGEQHIPEYSLLIQSNDLSLFTKNVLKFLTKLLGLKRLSYVLDIFSKKYSAYDYLDLSGKQLQLQTQMANFWNNLQLDAIISPLFPTAAFKHGDSKDTLVSLVYAMSWNLFDYNAGIVPVTKVQEEEQVYEDPNNNDPNTAALKRAMKDAFGLPVCVQVITQPFQDEKCLRIMNQLEQAIQFQSNLALE